MNFVLALFSTFFSSLWKVFLKKSLTNNINLFALDFVGMIIPFFLLFTGIFLIQSGLFQVEFDQSIWVYAMILLNFFLYAVWAYISSSIYKVEKISYLIPYEYLWRIISILGGFFVFQDVSLPTFYIAVCTIWIIIISTFDFRNLKFSFPILLFAFGQIISWIGNVLAAYILFAPEKWWLGVTGIDFFVLYFLLWFLVYVLCFFLFWWGKQLKTLGFWSFTYRSFSGIFLYSSWFLSLVIIAKLGLTMSILFWFFWMGFTLLLSYFFFSDIPSKKNIFLTLCIFLLVSLWFYFK